MSYQPPRPRKREARESMQMMSSYMYSIALAGLRIRNIFSCSIGHMTAFVHIRQMQVMLNVRLRRTNK